MKEKLLNSSNFHNNGGKRLGYVDAYFSKGFAFEHILRKPVGMENYWEKKIILTTTFSETYEHASTMFAVRTDRLFCRFWENTIDKYVYRNHSERKSGA